MTFIPNNRIPDDDTCYGLYQKAYSNITSIKISDNLIESITSKDIELIDNYKCLICNSLLEYKPMDILKGAETGECTCRNTSGARNIINGNIKGIPIRDIVISLPNNWTIIMQCHGTVATWTATPFKLDGNTSLSRIVHAHALKYVIKLDEIPEFFKDNDLNNIINWLDNLLPFI